MPARLATTRLRRPPPGACRAPGRRPRRLPAPQREAFLLAEEGASAWREIAAATQVGRETVRAACCYAMAKLRAALEDLL